MEEFAHQPFGRALAEALREKQNDPLGRVNFRRFYREVDQWSGEYIRQMVNGDRPPKPDVMEAASSREWSSRSSGPGGR